MNKLLSKRNLASLSISELVEHFLLEAAKLNASDIHIDPTKNSLRIRFRLDGILQEIAILPKELSPPVISRFKVLARLRTDEHQKSQDGRFHFSGLSGEVDIRISIIPTYYGENAVLRLLTSEQKILNLTDLGFEEKSRQTIESAVKKTSGMILVSGPTGSGKTTTLYNLLAVLNTEERSIVTIEDPIEYALAGLEQIQVNASSGLTFANGLRAILRQDPDVIMVGEIRDHETASIAVNSALTGHLLLSTLHTNDSIGSLIRLYDLGVPSYLLASTISLIISQRLVRKICDGCKDKRQILSSEFKALLSVLPENFAGIFEEKRELFYGQGCNLCGGRGFVGRISINEILEIDQKIREMILRQASQSEIRIVARQNRMISIKEDGFKKVLAGYTTPSEIIRVIHD